MRLMTKLAAATLAVALTAGAANAQVVVSSKIDTEGGLLGNIISQVLQANNVPVTEKIQLGPTQVVRDAIACNLLICIAFYGAVTSVTTVTSKNNESEMKKRNKGDQEDVRRPSK